jgi:hypothetical protein
MLTFSEALDPARAPISANYTLAEITVKGWGKHAIEAFKKVRVTGATYIPQSDAVILWFAGKRAFRKGARIEVHAGASGAADGITNLQGIHLAGDGAHEGTDATVRVGT